MKPYTSIGISRVPCARCGKPSKFQWQCCADGNTWRGVCGECDIKLNRLVLTFFRLKEWPTKIAAYAKKVRNS